MTSAKQRRGAADRCRNGAGTWVAVPCLALGAIPAPSDAGWIFSTLDEVPSQEHM